MAVVCAALASISHTAGVRASKLPVHLHIARWLLLVCIVRGAIAARIALRFNYRSCIEALLSSLDLLSQPDQVMRQVAILLLFLLASCRPSVSRLPQQLFETLLAAHC